MATASSSDPKALASSLSKLNISSSSKKPKSAPVANSWEDENLSSSSDTETEELGKTKHKRETSSADASDDGTNAPPPTPASPTGNYPEDLPYNPYQSIQPSRERGTKTPERRPEKTTSVAARLIAGGLGIKAPRRTEEQKKFDDAVKDKEKKRREEEKNKEREAEKAKASAWED